MFNFIIEVIIWILCIYGLLNIIKDLIDLKSYNKIRNKVKLILTVKNGEEGIENYIRQLNFSNNFFNNLVVIDLDSKDDTFNIVKRLSNTGLNIKLLKREEGIEYVKKTLAK